MRCPSEHALLYFVDKICTTHSSGTEEYHTVLMGEVANGGCVYCDEGLHTKLIFVRVERIETYCFSTGCRYFYSRAPEISANLFDSLRNRKNWTQGPVFSIAVRVERIVPLFLIHYVHKNAGRSSLVSVLDITETSFRCSILYTKYVDTLFYPHTQNAPFGALLRVRVERIELSSTAWKAVILPLNYTRI